MATVEIRKDLAWVVAPEAETPKEEPYLLLFNDRGEVLLIEDGREHLDVPRGVPQLWRLGFEECRDAAGVVSYDCNEKEAGRLMNVIKAEGRFGMFVDPDFILNPDFRLLARTNPETKQRELHTWVSGKLIKDLDEFLSSGK